MKKIVLTFGFLSGGLSAVMMFATVPFIDRIGFDNGAYVGYTAIVLSLLFVYFGVRSYRDNVRGGKVTFGRAFGVGLLITLISCACYVAAWEILYFNFMPDFLDKWAAHSMEQLRAAGATQAALDAKATEMAGLKTMYGNPLINVAMTFAEPFPIGLLVTLISAAVLRRK
ncbi:MAG: DUF4199 domain-containing protein [Acidobacteria bacterium]|nr:MAG: DUF4199 domain-containing protein [Acidobacteriota bacterium]